MVLVLNYGWCTTGLWCDFGTESHSIGLIWKVWTDGLNALLVFVLVKRVTIFPPFLKRSQIIARLQEPLEIPPAVPASALVNGCNIRNHLLKQQIMRRQQQQQLQVGLLVSLGSQMTADRAVISSDETSLDYHGRVMELKLQCCYP